MLSSQVFIRGPPLSPIPAIMGGFAKGQMAAVTRIPAGAAVPNFPL